MILPAHHLPKELTLQWVSCPSVPFHLTYFSQLRRSWCKFLTMFWPTEMVIPEHGDFCLLKILDKERPSDLENNI